MEYVERKMWKSVRVTNGWFVKVNRENIVVWGRVVKKRYGDARYNAVIVGSGCERKVAVGIGNVRIIKI